MEDFEDDGISDLYRKYRPRTFKGVLGQDEAVKQLQEMVQNERIPHNLLFTGGSGVGKTTLAYVVTKKLNVHKNDFFEVNCATSRGIDMVRDLEFRVPLASMCGGKRAWLLDEIHALTDAAQSALLITLEKAPSHVYFILCTTELQKVKQTIRTRCTTIALKNLTESELSDLIRDVVEKEEKSLSDSVVCKIAEVAAGSARQALTILHRILSLSTEEEQLNAIEDKTVQKTAVDIFKALLWGKTTWGQLAETIKAIAEDCEKVRRAVLTVACNELLKANNNRERAYAVLCAFESPFYVGKPDLARACYDVLGSKK